MSQKMRSDTRARLAQDLKARAKPLLAGECGSQHGLSSSRARYLDEWFRTYGLSDPMAYPDLTGEVPTWISGAQPEAAPPEDNSDAKRILVVGDTHAEPGQDFWRFDALGRAIADLNPTDVVMLGDHWGLSGLCRHSSNKEREGARYLEEKEAGNEALRRIEDQLGDWSGNKHLTCGNHGEGRVNALEGERPYLEGVLDLYGEARELGWNVVPFLEPLRIADFRFQHFFDWKGRAIASSTSYSRAVLMKTHFAESVVFGHSHIKDTHEVRSEAGGVVRGICAGCYFDHHEEYARDSNHMWWRGLLLMENAKNGDCDLVEFRMDTVKRNWG